MMTELYPAPPAILMTGACCAFALSWLLLYLLASATHRPALVTDRTIVAVSMAAAAIFIIVDTVLSVFCADVPLVFAGTVGIVACAVALIGAGLCVVTPKSASVGHTYHPI